MGACEALKAFSPLLAFLAAGVLSATIYAAMHGEVDLDVLVAGVLVAPLVGMIYVAIRGLAEALDEASAAGADANTYAWIAYSVWLLASTLIVAHLVFKAVIG